MWSSEGPEGEAARGPVDRGHLHAIAKEARVSIAPLDPKTRRRAGPRRRGREGLLEERGAGARVVAGRAARAHPPHQLHRAEPCGLCATVDAQEHLVVVLTKRGRIADGLADAVSVLVEREDLVVGEGEVRLADVAHRDLDGSGHQARQRVPDAIAHVGDGPSLRARTSRPLRSPRCRREACPRSGGAARVRERTRARRG
jgi:hypothetical protein